MTLSDELDSLSYETLALIARKLGATLHPCATKARVIMAIYEKLLDFS